MALGFIPEATFSEQTIDLASGDVLVAFSDGVVEASNAANDFFGDERLLAAIRAARGRSAKAIGQTVLEALSAFAGDTRPYDDVSIVVLRRV
jgi:sigma-B regulation protein RsbU (phosphoserine phosphatase)